MPTSTVSLVINSESPSDVEAYIRDCIDNAPEDWDLETADIETDGVITDLLDEDPESNTSQAEGTSKAQTQEEVVEQTQDEEDPIIDQPTGKEF